MHAPMDGVMNLAELWWQKQVMVKEAQNQRRLGGVCGEDGPRSKDDANTRSLPFFLISMLSAAFSSFSPSSLSCVCFKHLSKGT